MTINILHSEKYDSKEIDFGDGALESYIQLMERGGTYYISDTSHDMCDIDITSNKIVITSLKQADALLFALELAKKDMLGMSK